MKMFAFLLITFGMLGTFLSAFADQIGLNFTQADASVASFGWVQMLAVIFGVLILMSGVAMLIKDAFDQEDERESSDEVDEIIDGIDFKKYMAKGKS